MALTANIVVSRSSGPVPMPVYFEGTTSVDANGDSIDSVGLFANDILEYTWDFGEGSEGDVGGRYYTGFHAAHAYETVGVYTAKLTVRDASGTAFSTEVITIQTRQAYITSIDPGRDEKIYYVDATTGNDGDDGLSEGNAWETYAHAFAQFSAFTTLKAGDSLLFKRGETFPYTTGVRYGSCNNIYVGAYGAGADPILQNAGTGTGTGSAAIYDYSNGIQMVFSDLEVDCESTDDASLAVAIACDSSSELLLLRCNFHDYKTATLNNTTANFLFDTTMGQASGGNLYTVATRLAVVNNTFGPSDTSHNFYGNRMEGSVFDGNTFVDSGKQPDFRITPNYDDSFNIMVTGNSFTGVSGIGIQLVVSHATYGDTRNVIIERNFIHGVSEIGALHVDALTRGVLIRNNIVVNEDTESANRSAIRISENGVNPDREAVQGCHIYNNTIILQGTGSAVEIDADDHTDIIIKNNIVVLEDDTVTNRCVWVRDAAAMDEVTLDYNLYFVNGQTNLFEVDTTDFTLAEWRVAYTQDIDSLEDNPTFDTEGTTGYELLAGSPAVDVGESLADVYEDYNEDTRPVGDAYDIGAFEFDEEEPEEPESTSGTIAAFASSVSIRSNFVKPLTHSIPTDLFNLLATNQLTDGTGANQFSVFFSGTRTVNAASESLDLYGGLVDVFGNTINFTAIKMIMVHNKSITSGEDLILSGTFINNDMLGGGSSTVILGPDGLFYVTSPVDGFAVINDTGDILTIDPSAANIEYDIALAGTV